VDGADALCVIVVVLHSLIAKFASTDVKAIRELRAVVSLAPVSSSMLLCLPCVLAQGL
jgi:hypothetical protein